ncbi:MAG TPA: O-antigen ligase family protein [Ktedonobacteraceae bacterium]|nr:O-antigen ligase family protein [Ktedonobacteraceae bacterium]
MIQNKSSSQSPVSVALPPVALTITLVLYLIMSVAMAYVMPILPVLGIIGAIIINLIVLFFIRSRFALPLYVVAAGPSTALAFSSSGILSRLYIGDLLFVFVFLIWILQVVLPERKSGRVLLTKTLLAPLIGLILVGLISIIYSRLYPDPNVPYTYPHSNVSITITNLSEMSLLIGLPMFLLVVPGLVRKVMDAKLVTYAYLIAGAMYTIGTIIAGPLGLFSNKHILGYARPLVFGESSSGLGTLIVLFANIAFSKALYTKNSTARILWLLLTVFYGIGVIMALGREAWIGLFLSSFIMLVIRTRNPTALLFLLVPLALLFIPGATNFFDPTQVYGSDRVKIAFDAINIWLKSPIFGVGAGNFQFFDRVYGTDKVGVAHNQFLSVLAEMGVQGLICLLWLIVAVGYVSAKYFLKSKSDLAKSIALSSIGFYISIVFGSLFTGIFIPSAAAGGGTAAFVEASYRWLLIGLVLSIPSWDKEAVLIEQKASEADIKAAQQVEQGDLASAIWA